MAGSLFDSTNTLEVLHHNRAERIRLSGIDCPEKGQAYGQRAKQAASGLVHGKDVTPLTHSFDKYGRTLVDVLLPDGTNVNHMLVKNGGCWWYWKYTPGETVLEGLEQDAREAMKELWADPQPVPPWECGSAARTKGDLSSCGQGFPWYVPLPVRGKVEGLLCWDGPAEPSVRSGAKARLN